MVEAAARKIYVVIGARGGTGTQIVHRLVEKAADQVAEIRAMVRDPSQMAPDALPKDDRVKLVKVMLLTLPHSQSTFKVLPWFFTHVLGRTTTNVWQWMRMHSLPQLRNVKKLELKECLWSVHSWSTLITR